ncbi:MAG: alcohol dehydrogenase catalytic domain-containing protein [Oscillospiraceae bacterium]|nr:alcohol dehydrogenase catalytic domain-containing protein [Oscillospiraceae bacterium]
MKALVLEAPGKLVMKDSPRPEPSAGEVLIKTAAATICTSDLNDIRFNPFGIELPMIMGHEGAGIVEAVGGGVAGLTVGDAVAAHPVIPCMRCATCKRGLPHLCDKMEHLGINRGGVFAEYFTIRADRVRKKPSHVSFAAAALMEPVCVCIEAVKRANVAEGGAALVIGDGPFGLMISNIICDMFPDSRSIISGTHDFKMAHARGAEKININKLPSHAAATAEIIKRAGGEGVGSAIICVGAPEALTTAIEVCRPRGTVCVFSAIHGNPPIDMLKIHIKELNICGSCNDMDFLDEAMAILAKDALADVITHELPIGEYEKAFELAGDKESGALKVCLLF